MHKPIIYLATIIIILFLTGPLYLLLTGRIRLGQDWRLASRGPAHILERYAIKNQAAIILLSAPAFNWRGMFSAHTWLAVKNEGESKYTIYQVIGWNQYRKKPIVDVSHGVPDKLWYGMKPKVDGILIGEKAQVLLADIKKAVNSYPYAKTYRAWPGPNSNTFISYVIRQVPELHFTMPYNALGRDYGSPWHLTKLSLGGALGYQANAEAIYVNFLGLTMGVSLKPFGFIVPGIGLASSG